MLQTMMEEMEYLRLPAILAKSIQHPEDYIRKNDNKEPIRKIFKNVPITQEERKLIQSFKEYLKSFRIEINPESQTDEVLLRFLYSNNLNLEQSKEHIRGHLNWLREPKNYEFDQDILDIYNKGIMYILGRDKQYRPTIIINCESITTFSTELIMRAISILCMVMEDYFFFDGKVENWNVIIDLKEKCLLNIQTQDYYKMFSQLYMNFPCSVEKIFVLHPSMSVQLSWNECMEHTQNKKKVMIISDYNLFKKFYEPNQLEKKYGGKLEIKKYFPPFNTLPEGKQLTEPLKVVEALTLQQYTIMPTKQSLQLEQGKETIIPTQTLKQTKKIERDFSVYPAQEINDFKVYQPAQTTKEPIKNISKYNRLTQAEQMKKEYEQYLEQEKLRTMQEEIIMKTQKLQQQRQTVLYEEVLSEQIGTSSIKQTSIQGTTIKNRITAKEAEEETAACKIF